MLTCSRVEFELREHGMPVVVLEGVADEVVQRRHHRAEHVELLADKVEEDVLQAENTNHGSVRKACVVPVTFSKETVVAERQRIPCDAQKNQQKSMQQMMRGGTKQRQTPAARIMF